MVLRWLLIKITHTFILLYVFLLTFLQMHWHTRIHMYLFTTAIKATRPAAVNNIIFLRSFIMAQLVGSLCVIALYIQSYMNIYVGRKLDYMCIHIHMCINDLHLHMCTFIFVLCYFCVLLLWFCAGVLFRVLRTKLSSSA